MRRLLQLSVFLLLSVGASAEESPTQPTAPEVKNLGGSRHQIGKIVFDSKLKTIEFGAGVEQTEVLVEYLLVNQHGKIHESIFITDILPFNLNVAMKLLGFQESKELLHILDEDHIPTAKLHPATKEQKQHSRFSMSFSWELDGKTVTLPAHKLVKRAHTKETLSPDPWVYSGSTVQNGKYKPDLTGDIFAIFTDAGAVANYSGEGHDDDTLWLANRKVLPPYGTPVRITLKKLQSTDSK